VDLLFGDTDWFFLVEISFSGSPGVIYVEIPVLEVGTAVSGLMISDSLYESPLYNNCSSLSLSSFSLCSNLTLR
jgi:hypothetical protein